jgi:uncharacterized membrane protein
LKIYTTANSAKIAAAIAVKTQVAIVKYIYILGKGLRVTLLWMLFVYRLYIDKVGAVVPSNKFETATAIAYYTE